MSSRKGLLWVFFFMLQTFCESWWISPHLIFWNIKSLQRIRREKVICDQICYLRHFRRSRPSAAQLMCTHSLALMPVIVHMFRNTTVIIITALLLLFFNKTCPNHSVEILWKWSKTTPEVKHSNNRRTLGTSLIWVKGQKITTTRGDAHSNWDLFFFYPFPVSYTYKYTTCCKTFKWIVD